MSESCASRSTILPLPSSPHCAPTMTVAGTRSSLGSGVGSRRRGPLDAHRMAPPAEERGVIKVEVEQSRECRVALQERELHRVGRAVAVLGKDYLSEALLIGLIVVVLVAIDERDEIAVLLDAV